MREKVAIVGYGGMGNWHHKALIEFGKVEVIGYYDVRADIPTPTQNMTRFDSFSALLKSDATIIVIATPNDSHKDYAIQALEAGKHVVCEKPVTLNSEDLVDIMQVAYKAERIFTIHQNRRWDTDFRKVKQIIDNQTIGTPYFIESRVNGSSVFLHGWRDFKVNGGGMLYDWGVHLIDQLLQLTDAQVISVTAHVKNVFSEQVDDNVKLLLEFSDGLSAVVEVATNCFIPMSRWHVSGKSGTVVIENWDCDGKIVRLVEGENAVWSNEIVYTAAGPTRTMAPRPSTSIDELPLPTLEDEEVVKELSYYSANKFYGNLLKVIDGAEELIVKPVEALRVIKVLEAAFIAAERHGSVSCSI